MKSTLGAPEAYGYSYYVDEPDENDPTEEIFDVPDPIAQDWLRVVRENRRMQKEVDDWYLAHKPLPLSLHAKKRI